MVDNKRDLKNNLDSKKKKVKKIISYLESEFPNAKCHLNYTNPLELLVASILSAQCTDKRVNKVTEQLFKKYPSVRDFANADKEELEKDIYSTGFYANKSKSIITSAKVILKEYDGNIPSSMKELTKLTGVGRKTANVVLGNYFGILGIIVDTHIGRVSKRLGLTDSKNPEKIERDLMELVPKKKWPYFSNALGDHGRTVCKSRNPKCGKCKISYLCPSAGTFG